MPFWWRRRRRWFRPRTRRYRKFRPKRRRVYRRRRPRKSYRRRRKRRYRHKVKRKRKTITIKQWQPDSIVKCKIKGTDMIVLGSQGKQFVCYTNVIKSTPPPKAPTGGGFGCMQFSLGYLYEEYKFRRNIWTKSNIAKDLVRYLRCRLTFYRHPETDFIVKYDRQPPFPLEPLTYPSCHPQNLLLGKHKFLVLSKSTKPNGKLTKKKIIKPPKQMLTKWFFQHDFSTAPLFQLIASAANLQYSHIGCCNKNTIVTFQSLNPGWFKIGSWAQYKGQTAPYLPYNGKFSQLYFFDTSDWPADNLAKNGAGDEVDPKYKPWTDKHMHRVKHSTYSESVSYTDGFFSPGVITAVFITTELKKSTHIGTIPLVTCRYNPAKDNGVGNTVWLHSNLSPGYDKPTKDKTIIIRNLPLWMIFYGWLSYVQYVKKASDFLISYTVCIECPAIDISSTIGATNLIIPIDQTFTQGKPPYGQDLSASDLAHWYPDIYNQVEVINSLVTVGPYVPKYELTRNSTWELHFFYEFLFKWGGPETTEPPVADPAQQPTYDALDKQYATIQIRDPRKQIYESIVHPWDYRRGVIKSSALKRIQDNISIESSFQEGFPPYKRKRITGPFLTAPEEDQEEIQSCLQELFKESTSQEAQEETNLLKLIQQQRDQQQQLKYNLLRLISNLKEQQEKLKLQTGFI
nr:MAG: ORF1 [Torque teno midi virus]